MVFLEKNKNTQLKITWKRRQDKMNYKRIRFSTHVKGRTESKANMMIKEEKL